MSTVAVSMPRTEARWMPPSRGRVGMLCFIAAESAVFVIFLVAYIFYLGKSIGGPTPRQVLDIPVFYTVCLLSSSLTVHLAVSALRRRNMWSFQLFWVVTLLLGVIFLFGTGREWHHLIYQEGLTISTNLFGTCYYSLVGLHAFHVIVGAVGLSIVTILSVLAKNLHSHAEHVDVFSLYWHFVDVVWVAVFTVVYIVGR
jgi:cytochrome c oxidase subunit III